MARSPENRFQLSLFNWHWRRQVFVELRAVAHPIVIVVRARKKRKSQGGYTDVFRAVRAWCRDNASPLDIERRKNSSAGRRMRNLEKSA